MLLLYFYLYKWLKLWYNIGHDIKYISYNDTNAFRYCGEYYDKETATVYLRARNYNPSTGRFISRDSFAGRRSDPLSLNLYTYCRNNPIYYSDPSGHDAVAGFLTLSLTLLTPFFGGLYNGWLGGIWESTLGLIEFAAIIEAVKLFLWILLTTL